MNMIGSYVITGIPILIGLVITFKEAGWPSERERKDRALRSIRSALGATVLSVGVIIGISYQSSPGNLIADLSITSVLKFVFLIVLPIFCVMLVGSFIQYSAWDKTEPLMRDRVRKIVKAEKKHKGNI